MSVFVLENRAISQVRKDILESGYCQNHFSIYVASR